MRRLLLEEVMVSRHRPPLLNLVPRFERYWTSLMEGPTPVGRLRQWGASVGHHHLFVKREDLTAPGYGGNKVRNLEFLLGWAKYKGFTGVATMAPLGSNFVAAAAAQSARAGLRSSFFHFVPETNNQIEKHETLTRTFCSEMKVFKQNLLTSIPLCFLWLIAKLTQDRKIMRLPTGGSSPWGAMGHVNAALELAEQVRAGEIPEPDFLVVGVGTCGTMAGLLVGLRMAGLKTQVIGVRCVDRIICNEFRIARLANRIGRLLQLDTSFSAAAIELRDHNEFSNGSMTEKVHYGRPLSDADSLIQEMHLFEGIWLDTTYTTKVIHFLKGWLQTERFSLHQKNILYWHTFSPAAMEISTVSASLDPSDTSIYLS